MENDDSDCEFDGQHSSIDLAADRINSDIVYVVVGGYGDNEGQFHVSINCPCTYNSALFPFVELCFLLYSSRRVCNFLCILRETGGIWSDFWHTLHASKCVFSGHIIVRLCYGTSWTTKHHPSTGDMPCWKSCARKCHTCLCFEEAVRFCLSVFIVIVSGYAFTLSFSRWLNTSISSMFHMHIARCLCLR